MNDCILESINMTFYYIGQKNELPSTANIGDVCSSVDGHEYIYDGDNWQVVGSYPDIPIIIPDTLVTTIIPHPTVCKCCGAILKSNVCEYCGAEYFKE